MPGASTIAPWQQWHIHGAVYEKLLGVGAPTGAQFSVRAKILMHNRDPLASIIKARDDHTASAKRLRGPRRTGMAVPQNTLLEFPIFSPTPVVTLVEYSSKFTGGQ